jgi:hypothetical protein
MGMIPVGGIFDFESNTYTTGSGQVLHRIHEGIHCLGTHCVIHNPMRGPWSSWPTFWRDDRRIMERICPHGVGHPAVEDRSANMVHGCCGCPCAVRKAKIIDGEVVVKEIEP